MSTIAPPTIATREGPAIAAAANMPIVAPTGLRIGPSSFEAAEREQLLDRLQNLRRVLPVLAQEMASARRQAARLRSDNRKLTEQVRQLRAGLEQRERRAR